MADKPEAEKSKSVAEDFKQILMHRLNNSNNLTNFLKIFSEKSNTPTPTPNAPSPNIPPTETANTTCHRIYIDPKFTQDDFDDNTWILTVVSAKYQQDRGKFKFGVGSRSPYIRTFILYNLGTGDIIPCLFDTVKTKGKKARSPKTYCESLKTGDEGIIKIEDLKNNQDKIENMKIINLCNNYYNICGKEILDKQIQSKKNHPKNKEKIKDRKSYIKKKTLLNIHIEELIKKLKDNPTNTKETIRKEVFNILKSISDDGDYETKINNQRKPQLPSTNSVKLLRFQNKLKISTTWFNPKGNIKEFKGVFEGKVQINRNKWSNTTQIIQASKLNDSISNVRYNWGNEKCIWAKTFSKKPDS